MSNLEHLIENSLSKLEKFIGSGEDVDAFNEHWRESILTDPNYEGVDISPEDIMTICVYFLFTWCQYCDKWSE